MGRTVLVVEDDEDVRETLRDVIGDEGYETIGAANGQEALALLKDGAPHLILLDLMMPVMDGWQLLTKLRSDPRYAHLPVLVMSASGDAHRSLPSTQPFMRKPLSLGGLMGRIHELCDRAS
ncbi:MAG: Response regulator [Myxococcaceae bacterium]|nr:Response regulator [Myxococcaceae bacterium]